MSTALVSPFFDLNEVLCKNTKMMSYNNNNNIIGPTTTNMAPLLDRKAVGTPAITGFQRRHSVTTPNARFNHNQVLNSLKLEPLSSTAIGNKENKFRERSFSEGGDRLLQKSNNSQVNSSRYKTELCRPFEENGTCKYGDKCQFAHGVHELRSLTRHPKYKTELCRTFHTIGFCPYGPRCHFIHNAEERRTVVNFPLHPSNKMERPRLQHSLSFAGFPTTNGLLDSPTSVTPPPIFSIDDLPSLPDCANNPFTFSSQELVSLFAPTFGMEPPAAIPASNIASSPTAILFRPTSESPQMFEPPPSPGDSLSDQDGYLSSSSSHSGSESPTLDSTRRLPIFSRLSISDD
ncbi:mRNA decay activator protein ZFP36L1 [Latimeria chalumnae]|uniref:mRNA decay activator protein ZFP36 n=1 Tax=Latimeria chalumnae TaxID=7897 RepID=H3B8A2_LATCH|nr:PREDICTED: zinc finger protein 36, C3H1 type-like 1 isoform X2 [Latimeria chalumnae]XP_005988402.1 PREDICTED: zinc finger protein 36, C3H1 type-like 1 isoform X2 [Latimeria chalumnae]XP_005988403.1 PREDICTED: zinc finger protein 36, C3H1 type-like 1 isoform X2 [Latimeria chalumnae]|eukprot:XP_005988401.1 PREDICTED: zinc finger protein 36, C3H1 type-like 1 isoform X2 [Latimeria chalumnae]